MKRPFQSTRPIKIRANLADFSTLQTLYLDLKPLVEHLDLSYECARYYAYSVIKAQIPQVSRRADHDRLLHLIAFIAYQTFKLNDTLIDTLLSAVQAVVNSAVKAQKEVYFKEREQRSQALSGLADKLRQSVQETLSSTRHILTDTQLRDSQKIALIDAVVNTKNTKANVETQIDEFKKNVTKLLQGQDYFTLLESHSLKLQHRVADILRQIQFAPNGSLPCENTQAGSS